MAFEVVSKIQRNGLTVYLCEVSGFGYRNLGTAEHCEEYCDTEGYASSEITRRAIYTPRVQVLPIARKRALRHS